jgi:excisionase family DNA binding protein
MTEFPLTDRLALSVTEAALAVGVSERQLRKLLREIPHTYFGQQVVIPRACLEKWLIKRSEANLAIGMGRFHEQKRRSSK